MGKTWWWLAVNGSVCSASPMMVSLREVEVRPIPEKLLGFASRDVQLAAQRFLQAATAEDVANYFKALLPRVEQKQVVLVRPEHPEPPAQSTSWTRRARGKPVSTWLMDAVTEFEREQPLKS